MSKRSAPSAHDVARIAGVSQAAVSRAFTPGASIAEATREKVLQAAQQLGYRPNLLARSLIKGESGIIGVVVGSIVDELVAKALDRLSTGLAEKGKHILMFTIEEARQADEHVENLLKFRVDALLLMSARLSTELADRCYDEGIPVIFFNQQFGKHKKSTSVIASNRKGTREMAKHLVEQGFHSVSIIGGPIGSSTCHERVSAFSSCLTRLGFPPHSTELGNCNRNETIKAARRLLSSKDRPDAIFCANDRMALTAMDVARFEFGLEVGRDIGIAGFDDIEAASWPSFNLTTYSFPIQAMTEEVLRILLSEPRPEKAFHKTFDGKLRIRGSTERRRADGKRGDVSAVS